ncbi:MAG TPA: ABC transporter permease [Pyrinomonadaceae bacterium]|nr:ABC transporter permease [Chloracidobacterium sp.]MBP9934969.1 ABC transporter permease [Pyrinomonadaceae bacterium]MBK7801403.1 ABC transporter permease [Chloracidobacterium sp.]MBK9436723.1 ABC transporter permease [Chloracidobacterium sp.]MBL0241713.1 ABC transporter permease [Chloracidobacterium sp.]
MKIWDLIRTANRNLFRNKLRTFLTVMAIFVGSFTLTMTNGLGDGMRNYVESQVKNIESDRVIMVRKKSEKPPGGAKAGAPEEYKDSPAENSVDDFDPNTFLLTVAQMETAIRGLDGVKGITPRYGIDGEYISLDGQKKYKLELGVLSEGITQKTEVGASISGTGQIVIPVGLAREWDADIGKLIGKTVTVAYRSADGAIKTMPLSIVGVATKGFMTNYNSFVDTSTAKTIYISQRTGESADKYPGFTIQMSTNDAAKIDMVKRTLDEKGFEADTIADTQKRTYDAIGIFKIGMSLFAFIALLAASFGIINTLVIAVLERTREIGLQKALGMGRGKIFAVFSLESVLIGFWGALMGTLGGIVVGIIANKVLITAYADSFEGFTLFVFTLPSMALVMAIVCAIAFLAGVMPAIRASRLNPIESLRYE